MATFIQRYLDPAALALVFLLGMCWGQFVGGRPLRIATGLTVLGVVLVLIAIALGG